MSGRDVTAYIPTVSPKLWAARGEAIPGVMITIPAHGGGLFISAPNLRILADQLHDTADAYDNGAITIDQLNHQQQENNA